MKKLAKVLLGAVMLSALFVGCNNGGLVANDVIDAPEVRAEVTKNGVIVLKWDAVKDVTGYDIFVKAADTKEWGLAGSVSVVSSGPQTYSYNVWKNEADYTFKVVAKATKNNAWSSESEITVTTPEEAFTDVPAPSADSIKITKVNGTVNSYNVSFPVNAGYKYQLKTVNATSDSAKALWYNNGNLTSANTTWGPWVNSWTLDGATVISEYKKNDDGDEIVVDPTLAGFNATISEVPYYVVIRAEPKNGSYGTTKYVVSTASASYDYSANQPTVSDVRALQIGATTAKVTFTVNQINEADVDPSRFSIYRKVRENVVVNGSSIGTNTSAIVKVGTAKKDTRVNSVAGAIYYFEDTINAYDQAKAYSYTYYVVVEYDDDNAWWSNGTTLTAASFNQNKYALEPLVNYISIAQTAAGSKEVEITVNVTNGSTAALTYGEFTTLEAARKAVASQVTTPLTLEAQSTTSATNSGTVTTDDVLTSSWNNGSANKSYKVKKTLEVGKSQKTTTEGTASTTVIKNTGKFYVFRATSTVDGVSDVAYKIAYINVNGELVTLNQNTELDY